MQCLAKSPRDRPGSFEVLAKELTGCCQELTGESYGRAKPSAAQVTRERKLGKADSLVRLSRGCVRRGDLGDAMARLREAQQIFEELGDRARLSTILGNQALVLHDWGRFEEAMGLLKEQEGICRELGDRKELSARLSCQAGTLHGWGRTEQAMGMLEQAEGICRELSVAEFAHSLTSWDLLCAASRGGPWQAKRRQAYGQAADRSRHPEYVTVPDSVVEACLPDNGVAKQQPLCRFDW
jgi:tetratricopeptide (TPR) repeat protein